MKSGFSSFYLEATPMSDPVLAYEKALYDALNAALSVPVYAFVPSSASMPYVVMDGYQNNADDDLVRRREQLFNYLSIWSEERSFVEVQGIIDTITTTLHQQRLTMTTGRDVRTRVSRKSINKDIDGETFIGSVTIEANIER